jgi:hypothetical protein
MKKTLKATAAIGLCCVLMVVVVIYTPKPTPEPTKGRETLEEGRQRREKEFTHLKRVSEALRKANEAVMKVLEATRPSAKKVRFNDEGAPYLETADLNPLIEANTGAMEALAEAIEAVKQRNEELQRLNEQKPPFSPLVEASIKANTQLIAALAEMSEDMKALTELLHHLKKENARPKTIRKVSNAIIRGNAIPKALTVQVKASNAYHEYQRARSRARW